MSEDNRLDELEKALQHSNERRKRSRRLWLVISAVSIISAFIITFAVSCDISSIFDGIPPISDNNIENINPYEDVNLSDKYVISEGKGVTVLGFEQEYAVVSDNGEITIYGDDSILVVTGNMVHMPDGTIIDFKVSPVSIQVLVNGAIAMIFRR